MNITRGKVTRAQRVVIYAPEGLGKSTLASQLPAPLFLDFESGTHHLDVARIEPESLQAAEKAIASLLADPQGFKTLVIDTIDWLEEAAIRDVVREADDDRIKDIESFGYGKGYVLLTNRMNAFLARLDQVIQRGINVVLLAHTSVTRFDDPGTAGSYDRFELKLSKDRKGGKGSASLVKEWCDALLLGRFDDRVKETGSGDRVQTKAIAGSGKERVLYCTHSAAWDAKNRHGLKDKEPWGLTTLEKILQGPEERSESRPPVPILNGPSMKMLPPPAADPIPGLEQAETCEAWLEQLCLPHEEKVNAYLKLSGEISETQTFRSVPPDYAGRIQKNPAGFLKVATA